MDDREAILAAHEHCTDNRKELSGDVRCGCFYCLSIFRSGEIDRWLNEGSGTALCPYCMVDSVIGETSGYPITREFLTRMREKWFGETDDD